MPELLRKRCRVCLWPGSHSETRLEEGAPESLHAAGLLPGLLEPEGGVVNRKERI